MNEFLRKVFFLLVLIPYFFFYYSSSPSLLLFPLFSLSFLFLLFYSPSFPLIPSYSPLFHYTRDQSIVPKPIFFHLPKPILPIITNPFFPKSSNSQTHFFPIHQPPPPASLPPSSTMTTLAPPTRPSPPPATSVSPSSSPASSRPIARVHGRPHSATPYAESAMPPAIPTSGSQTPPFFFFSGDKPLHASASTTAQVIPNQPPQPSSRGISHAHRPHRRPPPLLQTPKPPSPSHDDGLRSLRHHAAGHLAEPATHRWLPAVASSPAVHGSPAI